MEFKNILSALAEYNILNHMATCLNSMDRRYKITLTVAFPITLLTFSIFTFHYLLMDHHPSLPDIPRNEHLHAGRWFMPAISWLTGFANVPVLQQTLGILFQLGAGLLTLRLWGLRGLHSFGAALVVLIITIHPNNLSTYFYTPWVPQYTFSAFLASLAMLVAAKDAGCAILKILCILSGAMLICLTLAVYQAGMSVAVTIAVGYAIMLLSEHEGELKNLLFQKFRPVWAQAVAFGLGGLFYVLSMKLLGIKGAYGTAGGDIVRLTELPWHIVKVTWNSFYALWVTQPELHHPIKLVLLLTLVLAAIFLASTIAAHHHNQKKLTFTKLIVLAMLLVMLIMATKAMFYTVTMPSFFIYRYNLAMPFFTAFCFYVIFAVSPFKKFGLLRSFALVASVCVVFVFIRVDLTRQGILLAGHRHDLLVANRILTRVEALPGLDLSKPYYFIRLGAYSTERARMMNTLRPYTTVGGGHMDHAEIGASWATEYPLTVLGSRVHFKTIYSDISGLRKRAEDLAKERGALKWPHPSSVFVVDDMIVANM